MIETSAEQYFR